MYRHLLVFATLAAGASFSAWAQGGELREGYCFVKPTQKTFVVSDIGRSTLDGFSALEAEMKAKVVPPGGKPWFSSCLTREIGGKRLASTDLAEVRAWNRKNGVVESQFAWTPAAVPAGAQAAGKKPAAASSRAATGLTVTGADKASVEAKRKADAASQAEEARANKAREAAAEKAKREEAQRAAKHAADVAKAKAEREAHCAKYPPGKCPARGTRQ